MLSVEEALAAVLAEVRPFPCSPIPLNEALGLVLDEEIVCEIDSPPFDKALMDGYAVCSADLVTGKATLNVIEEVTAGQVGTRKVGLGEATRIMTGAPLPHGVDAVVVVETCEFNEASATVKIEGKPISPGANLLRQGSSMQCGETILSAGQRMRPQELGVLAELGKPKVFARRRPKIAVVATGDELVPIDQTPQEGEIRNSNETMLLAQCHRAGAETVSLGIATDDRAHLREKIESGLQHDILLLSGGVSAGKLDLVPPELESAGVRKVFHKVNLKPGKPIWFGVYHQTGLDSTGTAKPDCYVFALPGNPVSSMVCFELFARSAIRRLMGAEPAEPQAIRAVLLSEHIAHGDRPTYQLSKLTMTEKGPVVRPVQSQGSADLRATVEANSMTFFEGGERTYAAGELVNVFDWRD